MKCVTCAKSYQYRRRQVKNLAEPQGRGASGPKPKHLVRVAWAPRMSAELAASGNVSGFL